MSYTEYYLTVNGVDKVMEVTEGAIVASEDMQERYCNPMQVAQEQYERDTIETERLQSVIDGFRLSKAKGMGGDDL